LFYAGSKTVAEKIRQETSNINKNFLMNVKNIVNIDGPEKEINVVNMLASQNIYWTQLQFIAPIHSQYTCCTT
jgi:hypothetical protein